jgi:S1-C subfamily serine protease
MKLAPIAPATLTPILVPVRPANPAGSTIDGAMAAAAVTTVGEHGKGLLLGDGYVLTAASLVDSVTGVAVTLPSGASTTATMVRRDNTAGVVLLRVGDTSMPGQPIQPRHNAVGDIVYASGPSGLVKGSFTSTRSSAGFDAVKLAGVAVGSPVMDPAGNVIGLLLPDQHFVSIGVVFHTLQLGAQLTEE